MKFIKPVALSLSRSVSQGADQTESHLEWLNGLHEEWNKYKDLKQILINKKNQ